MRVGKIIISNSALDQLATGQIDNFDLLFSEFYPLNIDRKDTFTEYFGYSRHFDEITDTEQVLPEYQVRVDTSISVKERQGNFMPGHDQDMQLVRTITFTRLP